MSKVIRVDAEVYATILECKHRLEMATGKVQSMGDTVAFLVALKGDGR